MYNTHVEALAESLGVLPESLRNLQVGRAYEWCEGTYSFPMRDANEAVIGLRLRNAEGHKWAVYGSRNGLFIPMDLDVPKTVCVCEGPTTAAAILSWGFYTIGKPSNSGGLDMLRDFLKRVGPRNVVIISENDARDSCEHCEDNYCLHCHPGDVGADMTAKALDGVAKTIRIINPLMGKDAREWRSRGGTAAGFISVVDNTPNWHGGQSVRANRH